jgi:predicted metal-binding membrane protein
VISRRDRILIATCILLICAVAWAYLVHLDGRASSSHASATTLAGMGMSMGARRCCRRPAHVHHVGRDDGRHDGPECDTGFLLLLAASKARRGERGVPTVVLVFGLGYLTIWLGFSVVRRSRTGH